MSLNQSFISDFSEYYRWSQRTKIKYKLHYGWCMGRRFTAATWHNASCSEVKYKIRNEILKSNENIHKKEGGSYYEVSANKASSVTLQSPGNESQRKHTEFCEFQIGSWFKDWYKSKWGPNK